MLLMAAPAVGWRKKVEGKFPSWLQACICGGKMEFWCVGLKPNLGTQRFLPSVCSCRALDRTVSEVFRQSCLAI